MRNAEASWLVELTMYARKTHSVTNLHDIARLVRLYEGSAEASKDRLLRLQLCMRLYRLARYAEWMVWAPGGSKIQEYRAFEDDDQRQLAQVLVS